MTIIEALSPNQDDRGVPVSLCVLHYTGMKTGEEALARMRDPEAQVSAHYMVEEDGRVFRLVSEDRRAWHAGVAEWRGQTDINARSVGIEIVNPGHEWGYRSFPEEQIRAVLALVGEITTRHGIGPAGVIGHSDVAPDRKEDPGELFPWDRLAARGLALPTWREQMPNTETLSQEEATVTLEAIGYAANRFGLAPCLTAFQRRFAPKLLGEGLTPGISEAIRWAARLSEEARIAHRPHDDHDEDQKADP